MRRRSLVASRSLDGPARLRPIGLLVASAMVVGGVIAPASRGAENFACGAGGKPNAKTATCDCPAGKVEKTSGGTSRCVDKPSGTTTGTATGKPTTTTKPTTTAPSTTATPSNTTLTPGVSCPP